MPNKKKTRDDIILQLTQAAPSDDSELPSLQIDYWISVDLNALVANECNQKLSRGQMIPHVYIRKVSVESGEFEESTVGNQNRVFFELEDEVLAINNGGGILRVIVDDGTEVKRASVQTLSLFNAMRFTKPSENNLIYSHEGNNLYVEGLSESDVPFDSMEVWYVPKQDVLSMSDNDELLVSDLTLPMLIQSVVERGKAELYGTQPDQANDGIDNKKLNYHTAIKNSENNFNV